MNDASFWNDKDNSNKVIEELNYLKRLVEPVLELENSIKNNLDILSMSCDDEMIDLLNDEYEHDKEIINDLELRTYLSGEYDKNNCILF